MYVYKKRFYMEVKNKIGVMVVNNIEGYYYNNGSCIYRGYNIKDRDIKYKRYGIWLWRKTR